ncbi:MAG: hypothetical protein RLZZ620_1466, partial [Pseudomonadota bacterium]
IEGEDRQELREAMAQLEVPDGMSIIARTAGIGRDATELQWDLNYLMQLWKAIDEAAKGNSAPLLIYLESSLVIRAIRDYFQPDIGEILIDTDDIYEQAQAFMSVVMPDNLPRVKRYQDDVPLFSRFQIEHQIETAYSRTVPLPSGGAIVIDHTEALVSVDVNSARATRGSDIEETATRTNLEAADEIARQMRLRDLGGLIVIDFIDMESSKSQRDVENRLRDALRHDRARVQMGKISKFGLMELSRQRLRPALSEGSHVTCPRCNGTGHIRDTESSALQVLRIIQEEAMKENTAAIHCQVPVEVVAFLLNEKRAEVIKIETRFKVHILMIPNKHLETPHYKLERLRHDDPRLDEQKLSYVMVEEASRELETDAVIGRKNEEVRARPEAAVKGITPSQPAPAASPRPVRDSKSNSSAPESGGFLGFIKKLFSSSNPPAAPETKPNPRSDYRGRNGDRNRNRGRNRNERNQRGDSSERIEKTIEPTEAAANRPPRSEGRNRNRGERQNNQEKVEIANAAPQVVGANDESEGSGDERRRGRNRRGRGRNRGERAERHETSSSTTNSESNPGFPMGLGGRSASVPLTRIVSTFRESTGGRRPNQRRERREEIATPVIETFAAPTINLEAVATPSLPELPRVAFTPLAEEPLKDVVQGAGMVWVGTDQSKLAEVQTQIQAESPAPRVPRVPKSPASLPTGPMVLVETGGQEKTIDKTV